MWLTKFAWFYDKFTACICIYVYTCVYIYIYVYMICIFVWSCKDICIYIYVYMYRCIYIVIRIIPFGAFLAFLAVCCSVLQHSTNTSPERNLIDTKERIQDWWDTSSWRKRHTIWLGVRNKGKGDLSSRQKICLIPQKETYFPDTRDLSSWQERFFTLTKESRGSPRLVGSFRV